MDSNITTILKCLNEAVPPEHKALSKTIKAWFKKRGVKVRVRVLGGKAGFIKAWNYDDPAFEFTEEVAMLAHKASGTPGGDPWRGNVMRKSITLQAPEWEAFLKNTP